MAAGAGPAPVVNVKLQGTPTAQTNEFGDEKYGAAVPVTVKINPASWANCPSGLITLTTLRPGVAATVDTVTVRCVESRTATSVTVTPPVIWTVRWLGVLKFPGELKNPEPLVEVPVSVKVVLAVPAGIEEML